MHVVLYKQKKKKKANLVLKSCYTDTLVSFRFHFHCHGLADLTEVDQRLQIIVAFYGRQLQMFSN